MVMETIFFSTLNKNLNIPWKLSFLFLTVFCYVLNHSLLGFISHAFSRILLLYLIKSLQLIEFDILSMKVTPLTAMHCVFFYLTPSSKNSFSVASKSASNIVSNAYFMILNLYNNKY